MKIGFDSPLWKTWGNLNYWLNWLNHQTCGNLTTQTNDFWLKAIWLARGQSQWRLAAILASPLDDRSREIHGDLGIPHDLRTPPGLGWTSCYPNYSCGWHWLTLYQPFRALSREFVFKLENDQELTKKSEGQGCSYCRHIFLHVWLNCSNSPWRQNTRNLRPAMGMIHRILIIIPLMSRREVIIIHPDNDAWL